MAEVKVTLDPASTPEEPIFNFEIPGGEKGDPGGIVSSTQVLTNSDLNDYKTPGVYGLVAVSGILNMPPTTIAGTLMVLNRGVSTILYQEYMPISSGAGQGFYRRVLGPSGVWGPWRAYNSTRTDQTAGRVIYQWDDLNNREQLIYGDTGWRNVTDLIKAPYSVASLKIRRMNNSVTLRWDNLKSSTVPVGSSSAFSFPQGFKPSNNGPLYYARSLIQQTANAAGKFWSFGTQEDASDGYAIGMYPAVATGSWAAVDYVNGGLTYETDNPWPTSLPGTAIGTIPNL